MEKETILKLIDLKVELREVEKQYDKELQECVKNNSYFFNEGGTTRASERTHELEDEIEALIREDK